MKKLQLLLFPILLSLPFYGYSKDYLGSTITCKFSGVTAKWELEKNQIIETAEEMGWENYRKFTKINDYTFIINENKGGETVLNFKDKTYQSKSEFKSCYYIYISGFNV